MSYLFLVPQHNPLLFCTTLISSPLVVNLIKSCVAVKAALVFLVAAALPILLLYLILLLDY